MAGGGRELAAGDSAERGRRAAQRCGRLTAETLHGRVGRATWGWMSRSTAGGAVPTTATTTTTTTTRVVVDGEGE